MRATDREIFIRVIDPLLSCIVFVFFHVNIIMHIVFLSLNFYLYCKKAQNKLS